MKDKNLENKLEKPSIKDFTRKSILGAVYRVGTSFALDGLFLTGAKAIDYINQGHDLGESITMAAGDYITNFNPEKFARVSAWVVGINFGDYKWSITDKLDNSYKKIANNLKLNYKKS